MHQTYKYKPTRLSFVIKSDFMSTTVHLDIDDTILIKSHKGLRSEAILKLSDACDIFLTKDHLLDIKKAIDEHLERSTIATAPENKTSHEESQITHH